MYHSLIIRRFSNLTFGENVTSGEVSTGQTAWVSNGTSISTTPSQTGQEYAQPVQIVRGTERDHINTWDDWKLIPLQRPNIEEAEMVQKYVDVPGRNGSLDFSDYLAGEPTFSDRKGTIDFYALPTTYSNGTYLPNWWVERKRAISQYLIGQKVIVALEDDPTHGYFGRLWLKQWQNTPQQSRVTLEYRLSPFDFIISST